MRFSHFEPQPYPIFYRASPLVLTRKNTTAHSTCHQSFRVKVTNLVSMDIDNPVDLTSTLPPSHDQVEENAFGSRSALTSRILTMKMMISIGIDINRSQWRSFADMYPVGKSAWNFIIFMARILLVFWKGTSKCRGERLGQDEGEESSYTMLWTWVCTNELGLHIG